MTNTDLKNWHKLKKQAFQNDSFVDEKLIKERLGYEYWEFIRLNHMVMEQVHQIHNLNMLA